MNRPKKKKKEWNNTVEKTLLTHISKVIETLVFQVLFNHKQKWAVIFKWRCLGQRPSRVEAQS